MRSDRCFRGVSLFIVAAVCAAAILVCAGPAVADQAQAPVINPNGGAFTTAQSVTIGSIPSGATAYYTTDGSDPTVSSSRILYSGAFTVSQSETVRAAFYGSDSTWSGIATATFTINSESGGVTILLLPAVETDSPASLTANSAVLNGNITNNGDDTITDYGFYYSADQTQWTKIAAGTDNHYGSFNYSLAGLAANTSYYFKAYATNPEGTGYGGVISFTTLAQSAQPAGPVINPNGGAFTTAQSVTIGSIPSGATAYYTTDGSDPTTTSTAVAYSGAFTVSQSVTVRAAVRDPALGWSDVVSAAFTIGSQTSQGGNSQPAQAGYSSQFDQLQQDFAAALGNNQMEQAAQILKQIEQINQAQVALTNLEQQLADALNSNKPGSAEAILKAIIDAANPGWAYTQLGQIYQQQGATGISVFVNGDEISFDVQPVIVNDRTLVPIRKIANALGLPDSNINWNDDGTVTITDGANTIVIRNNDQQAYLNGSPYNIDVPAQIIDGRMMVPLRAISQLLNKNVQWYPVGRIAAIS